MRESIKFVLYFFFTLSFAGCGRGGTILVEKDAGSDRVAYEFNDARLEKWVGSSKFHVEVRFPEELRQQRVEVPIKLKFYSGNPASVVVKVPYSSNLEIEKLVFQGPYLRVSLKLAESHPAATPGRSLFRRSYESPARPLFEFDKHFNLIGVMRRVDESVLFGLIAIAESSCTSFPVGKNLVMTNFHCISSQAKCDSASFTFWSSAESNLLGTTKTRDFKCSQLIFSDSNLDVSIVSTVGDPTAFYGKVRMMAQPKKLLRNTPVVVLSQNPVGKKRSNHCRIGEDGLRLGVRNSNHYVSDATELFCSDKVIHGDSGSPVFNYHGDLVGIVWGSDSDDGHRGTMTPISAIRADHQQVMSPLPIEWIER